MAGKKRDGGSVKVKITDDGSLKNLGKNAKKAGKDVGSVAKNVQESDRRLKSLSQQTSNSTKAFSKQAQTIGGGLVPIYATIAAQVFAVSAAFRFLQDAMETRNMIEGQKTFGAVTGQAFATMTSSVQKATADMITFKEAASAVAIGSAAGLTRSQLEGLGTAAKNASLALGRDVTDAFNRLIRGVTKAEPELLDELGIILRLEPATEKYAISIGKARTELNAFERSQAVANEVLDQAERKFGAIATIMDPDAFALGQFAKEFDDLMKVIKVNVIEVVIPVVQFFKENLLSLIGVLGLLAAPILSQILPDFGKMASKFSDTADASTRMAKSLKKDSKMIEKIKTGGDIGKSAQKEFTDRGRTGMQGMLSGMDMSDQSATLQKAAKGKKLNAKELGVLKRHLKQKNNIIGRFTRQDQLVFDKYIKHQELGLKGSLTKSKLQFKQLGIVGNKTWATIKAGASTATAATARFGATAVKWGGRILGAFGWISIVLIAVQALYKKFFPKKEATAFEKKMKELGETMGELNTELYRMEKVSSLGLLSTSIEKVVQQANSLKTSDVAQIIRDYNEAVRGGADKETLSKFAETAERIARLNPEMKPLIDMMSGKVIDQGATKEIMGVANSIMSVGQALGQMAEQLQEVSKQFQSLITGAPTSKFTKLQKSIQTLTDNESGAFGENAFLAREQANKDMTKAIEQRATFSFVGRNQELITGEHKGKPKDKRAFRNSVDLAMGSIENIAGTQLGLDAINAALGEEFKDEKDVKNYFTDKGVGKSNKTKYEERKFDINKILREIDDQYNFGDKASDTLFNNRTLDMQNNQKLDGKTTEDDKGSAKLLKGYGTEILNNIREENTIRKANNKLKFEAIGLSVNANKEEQAGLLFLNNLDQKRQGIANLENELAAARLIATQEYAEATDLNLEDLNKQVDLGQEKLDIAREELRIAKEKAKLAFAESGLSLTRSQERLGAGSFGSSFINKQRDFVLGKRGDIELQGANAYDDTITAGGSEADAQAAKVAMIDQQTAAYAAQYYEVEKVNSALKLQQGISTRLTEGLANDMAGALVSVAQGTKTMKQAFGDMAISILADITKMIIKQMILAAIMAVTGMANPGAAAGLSALMGGTPARQGGVMQPGAGGGYRSYRSGGVADGPEAGYPATLHGTEAVVPLGNDKSIPVKMLEGSSGTNNVNVTVNMTEGGTDFKMEGEKAKAFGSSIAAAVQQEIVKQQRTGGLLSSY